jgi:ABC-type lipoprotein release transport system permease subunit
MKHKKFITLGLLSLGMATNLFAASGAELASQLGLDAGTKAKNMWERAFSAPDQMKRFKIDTLSSGDQSILKKYLMSNAADADKSEKSGS